MAQGVWQNFAAVHGWKVATRGSCGEGEGLTWTQKEVQAAGSSISEGCGGQRPQCP
jgi:hypothetical protein